MPPSSEPRRRGAGIDLAPGHVVLPPIEQYVDQTVPYLAPRAQRTGVIAVGPDFACAADCAVDRLREADAEPLQAPSERPRSVGLDGEMNVVRLHREVDDSELIARRRCETAAHYRKDAMCSE
jgi:hypothetical protein